MSFSDPNPDDEDDDFEVGIADHSDAKKQQKINIHSFAVMDFINKRGMAVTDVLDVITDLLAIIVVDGRADNMGIPECCQEIAAVATVKANILQKKNIHALKMIRMKDPLDTPTTTKVH